jgi:hypothetical protein
MKQNETELQHLVKGLSDKERAKLIDTIGISESTLYRWMKAPGQLITLDGATAIKAALDRTYNADHDLNKLARPIRVHGRKKVAA